MKYVAGCLTLVACALTSKAPPLELRTFSPEPLVTSGEYEVVASQTDEERDGARIRVGRITASDHLRYPIVFRRSALELETYLELRWTERPDVYVRRALEQALFVERGFVQAVGGRAPTLDVEVVVFEEVRRGPQRTGRVELRYEVTDDATVVASGTVVVERRAKSARIEDVVAAIGSALGAAADEVADRVDRACSRSGASRVTAGLCLGPTSESKERKQVP